MEKDDLLLETSKKAIARCIERFCHEQASSVLSDVTIAVLSKSPSLQQGDWAVSVCLQTESSTVDLQVFFSEKANQAVLAKVMSAYPAPSREYTGQEVMQECLNVVIGRLKGIIATELKVSRAKKTFLPVTRKIESDADVQTGTDSQYKSWWTMTWGEHVFALSCQVDVSTMLPPEILEALKNAKLIDESACEHLNFL